MKKLYKYMVKEVVTKYVEVEAENEDEAYQMALEEDMMKNYDDYSLEAKLMEVEYISPNYPQRLNSWEWTLDADSLTYWKRLDTGYTEVIGLVWLDTVEGDEGYNPDGDCWCVCCWIGDPGDEDVVQGWSETCRDISNVMRRKDAEAWLFDYMEMN